MLSPRHSELELALLWLAGAAGLFLLAVATGFSTLFIAKVLGVYVLFGFFAALLLKAKPAIPLGWANRVTLLRAAIACMFAGFAGEGVLLLNVMIVPLVAGAVVFLCLDGVDGWLARRRGEVSEFGKLLDHEADALFFLLLTLLVHETGKVGPWIIAAGILRYLYLALHFALPPLPAELPPTRRGQVVGIAAVIAFLVCLLPAVPAVLAVAVAAASFASLLWSFGLDGYRLLLATKAPDRGRTDTNPP